MRRVAMLTFVLSLLSLAATSLATAGIPPAMLGRWDMTFDDPVGTPSWFELRDDGGTLVVTFQGRYGAPEVIRGAACKVDMLEFTTSSFGRVRAQFNGTWFRSAPVTPISALNSRVPLELSEFFPSRSTTSSGIPPIVSTTLDARRSTAAWTAVRAPALPERSRTWRPAVALFDGQSLGGWHARRGGELGWIVRDGCLVATRGASDLVSDGRFLDFKLHLQYRLPPEGDSGVHLRGRYEIQLTDRPEDVGDVGGTGSVYGHVPPAAHPAKPAGQWNTLDVTLVGRRLTASLNGVTIHDHVEIPGITGDALDSREGQPGPIMLQGYLGEVEFRDIVITPAR